MPPSEPKPFPLVIVSRYEAFAALISRLNMIDENTPVFTTPHPEDVRGAHVLCDRLDLEIAAHAAVVTVIKLALPDDLDTVKAPLEVLAKFASKPETFTVRGSSGFTADQHKGGTTPLATEMAYALIDEFNLHAVSAEELADRLDSLLYDERRAGADTERLLLKMLTSAHDRRCRLEMQLLMGSGNIASSPPPTHQSSANPATP